MASEHALWSQLNHTLESDLTTTGQLLDLLNRERQSLEQRDYQTFQQLLREKQSLLQHLENQSKQRQQLLKAAGFSDETSTLQAADHYAPAVAQAWRSLVEQWKRCQELNAVNERIAQRTRLVANRILDILRGSRGGTRLYDNKGSAHTSGGGGTITSA